MKIFRYRLHIDNGTGEVDANYVYANSKSEARTLIAKFYRDDAPGGARNGFQPFAKTRIEWTTEEEITDPAKLAFIATGRW